MREITKPIVAPPLNLRSRAGFFIAVLGVACDPSGLSRPAGARPLETHTLLGQISGQLIGPVASARDARIEVYGYFEGDSVARTMASDASASVTGFYRVQISHSTSRQSSQESRLEARRWRAILIVQPQLGTGSALTVTESEWVTVKPGSVVTVSLGVDVVLATRGSSITSPHISMPNTLPTREAAVDLSRMNDSTVRTGREVFVRTTALPTGAALTMLASAGLAFGASHTAFHTFAFPGPATVWGRVESASSIGTSAISRIAALPFVVGIEPLGTFVADGAIPPLPRVDVATIAPQDERRLVYDRGMVCYTDVPSREGVSPVSCGTLIVGLVAGVRSSDVADLLTSIGATVARDYSDRPNGTGWLVIKVPIGSERTAGTRIRSDSRVRYAELESIGNLL